MGGPDFAYKQCISAFSVFFFFPSPKSPMVLSNVPSRSNIISLFFIVCTFIYLVTYGRHKD